MRLSQEDTLLKTGRTLCEKYGIQVVCHGLECCTDGDTIYLPGLPAELPMELWQAMRGYLDHEAGHLVAKSDFAGVESFVRQHGRQAFSILNALEDIRVEEVLCRKYPGSALNLQHGYEYAMDRSDPQSDMLWQVGTALYAIGRQRDYSMLSAEARQIAQRFTAIAEGARTAPDTKAVEGLALQVWHELQKVLPQRAGSLAGDPGVEESAGAGVPGGEGSPAGAAVNVGGKPSSNAGSQGQRADGGKRVCDKPSGDSPVPPAREDQNGASHEGSSQSGAHPCADTNSDQSVQGTTAQESAQLPNVQAPGGVVQAAGAVNLPISLKELLQGAGVMGRLGTAISSGVSQTVVGCRAYRPYSTRDDLVREAPKGRLDQARLLQQKARTVCAGITQKLLLSLQSQANARWLGDQDHGRLNPAALHKINSSTNPRIFRTRTKAESLNTAVTLLIDQSRSMKGERIHLAMLTALAFTESLERLNIPVAVEGFSTTEMTKALHAVRYDLEQKSPELVRGLRIVPLLHTRFKGFQEPLRQALPRFSSETVHELTPLGESLLHSAKTLNERKESRKLLFCLTDGKPVAGVGDESITFTHAKETIARIERVGIEVILIGIKEPAVQQLHEKHVVVNDLADLPKEVMRALSKLLREGRHILQE